MNHPPQADNPSAAPLAAILDNGPVRTDALLQQVAQAQQQAGRRVRGLLMTYPDDGSSPSDDPGAAACAASMVLVDIATGEGYLVSQPLGAGSSACRADPQGFARASGVLRRALDEAPDLVISNRFGNLEAEGRGFTAELLELVSRGIPVLTAVPVKHLAAWQRFSGGATVLPADAAAVAGWLSQVQG